MEKISDLFTTKLTIGVTGFSRSGKTVFIGALAQALVCADAWKQKTGQGPLAQFGPLERGQFRAARIRDDVHADTPQFPFRQVRDSLATHDAAWPQATEGISRLVLDLDYHTTGFYKRIKTLRIELIDYPGEWLVDLPMLEQSYAEWSEQALALAGTELRSSWSEPFFAQLGRLGTGEKFDEEQAIKLTGSWAGYLQQAADYGLSRNQPGRLLRPGALRNSPVLRLFPLPEVCRDSPFGKGMEKRFEEYKKKIIKPFFREHFKHIDRQIVMLDLLRVLQQGKQAFDEMVETFREVLPVFHYGRKNLIPWLGGTKISRLLFAATKGDHVTRGDRANLEQMVRRMLSLVDDRNELRSQVADYEVMTLASVRATEDRMTVKAPKREILYGRPAGEGKASQWDPGGLPLDMPPDWATVFFEFYRFEPPPMAEALSEGYPAINLGKALDYLIGEDLK
ncbi:YcjX family protein [Geothermobacter hydrogeniphilus]|nr:YcjX family protein [Geothermobacter hydrogeniphilus]